MKTYTLSELCDEIGNSLQDSMPGTYLVKAEISGMQLRSGHCYMELVEKSKSGGLFEARMRAMCWANTYTMLSAYFKSVTGQQLQNGMQVLVEVEVTFHNVYGLALSIVNIDPKYTLGDIQQQREKTILQLHQDGVFEMNKLLPFPSVIKRIALISSSEAAGYQDFCHQLEHNQYNLDFKIDLFIATMQGDRAANSICEALSKIADKAEYYDIVVITRGGGSTNDLSCFDDYTLCSYCAQFPLPIITAIGHTKDISVADQVAHLSLKTPTAAAAYIIDNNARQLDMINDYERRLTAAINNQIANRLLQLDNISSRMLNTYNMLIAKQTNRLDLIEKTIELHSPKRILKQGYTITLHNGKPITSIKEIHSGETLKTETIDGSITSIVV